MPLERAEGPAPQKAMREIARRFAYSQISFGAPTLDKNDCRVVRGRPGIMPVLRTSVMMSPHFPRPDGRGYFLSPLRGCHPDVELPLHPKILPKCIKNALIPTQPLHDRKFSTDFHEIHTLTVTTAGFVDSQAVRWYAGFSFPIPNLCRSRSSGLDVFTLHGGCP